MKYPNKKSFEYKEKEVFEYRTTRTDYFTHNLNRYTWPFYPDNTTKCEYKKLTFKSSVLWGFTRVYE